MLALLPKVIILRVSFHYMVHVVGEKGNTSNKTRMLAASAILIMTAVAMLLVASRVLVLHILVGQFFIHHWLSWAGAVYIAFSIPIIYHLKRTFPYRRRVLTAVHTFGNLLAVAFVSIHFTQEVTRPLATRPELGTGAVLYATMLLLVTTGYVMAFLRPAKLYRSFRFLHVGITLTFYMVIIVHALHGLGYI